MKPLAQKKGVLVEEPDYFGPRCFSQEAIRAFPELAQELTRHAELLHVQMGALASAGRAAIAHRDIAFLDRLFTFVEDILSRPRLHHEIPNAVANSFLLPADFDSSDTGRQVWQSLPEKVRRVLDRAA
jgi:hypothetical protein